VAKLRSTNINAGDPVTKEIINNIVADLNELNKVTVATVIEVSNRLPGSLEATVSSKVYSTVIKKSIKETSKTGGTWDFTKSNIKFNKTPRCWVQVQNSNTGLPWTAFDFNVVITSVSATSMTFQVRGKGFTEAEHEFICFAAEA
jgi:hypothetical protein